jgi:RhtB (resistance to homoserine/threonine) family protein|tara:strand:+ start:2784 stop:3422 length:639 start_codon:yes stop_codon:yes gene_type:complete
MELVQGLLIITSVHLLAAASPGPDFVLVSQQTISNGKKAGLLCSIGIALGLSIHILYSAFGLAAIIANSTTALLVIKLLGGSYLIFLGIKGLRSKSNAKRTTEGQQKTTAPQHSPLKTIGLGFLCNALNPKAPIYFVSLFTIVISTDTSASHLVIYGIWMMAIQLAWFSLVTVMLSTEKVAGKLQSAGHIIDRIAGGAMLLLGLKVIASRTN